MREEMLNIRIQNIGKQAVGASTGVPLPPPFHMVRLGPGEGDVSFCREADLKVQYPHRSGFRVADILQQLVQLGRIQVEIQQVGSTQLNISLAEFINEPPSPQPKQKPSATQRNLPLEQGHDFDEYEPSLIIPEPVKEPPPSSMTDFEAALVPEEPVVFDVPQGEDAITGDDMSSQDDLPEMVDPLYNTPPKGKAKKKRARPEPDDSFESSPSDMAVDLPDDVFVAPPKPKRQDTHKDKHTTAVRMAFIGAGQGGGRIAESFHKLGYSRVCCVNTTEQDLKSLEVPAKLIIGNNRGGAGKDPDQGRLAAKESYEDVMDLMMRSWGDGVEQMWVCVGAGGGSGTGSWPVLVKAAKEYGESTNVEKPISKHLGVIMTMPKRSEGARVQHNALAALRKAVEMVEQSKISTLILVDNAKIHELYPGLPVKKFWRTTNHNFAAMLHTFNLLAAKDSEYNTFDRADFRSVLRNGIVIFGMTGIQEYEDREDISQAVRQNLAGSLLADGFDLTKANMAGAIVVAHDSVLEEVPMENIDYALFSLGRALGNEGITIHSGLYEGSSQGMRVFTIVSGLEPPSERFEEIARLAT